MSIKGKPDIRQFIEAGENTEFLPTPISKKVSKAKPSNVVAGPKRKKLVELPGPVFDALKDRAYQEYKSAGRRVTETEIIIAALSQYLNV